jgi:hypothetical protein
MAGLVHDTDRVTLMNAHVADDCGPKNSPTRALVTSPAPCRRHPKRSSFKEKRTPARWHRGAECHDKPQCQTQAIVSDKVNAMPSVRPYACAAECHDKCQAESYAKCKAVCMCVLGAQPHKALGQGHAAPQLYVVVHAKRGWML